MKPRSIVAIILAAVLQTAWAQNSDGLFSEWTETDYSNFEITHEYFTPNGTAPSASGGYDMTGYIPVKEGDVIVFSGDRSPGIPFMVGYADNKGEGATVLLGDFDASNMSNIHVTKEEMTIPAGMAYVRCSARNISLPEWASRNMSVIKRSMNTIEQGRVVRVLAMGNSFTIDAMESCLYAVARDAGFHLVLGNACWGGFSFENHFEALVTDSACYEYRKCDNGHFTVENNTRLSTIIADEPWDIVVLQQTSHLAGFYDTYEPWLTNLIIGLKHHFPNAKYGLHMIWTYQQDTKNPKFADYGRDQMFMYNSIVDATRKAMETHPELEFLIPTGTAIQNLRTSFVGDNLNRDGSHLTLDLGRATVAYSWYAALFGDEATQQNAYTPYNLNGFTTTMVKNTSLDAKHNPYTITPQNYPDYTGENTIVPDDIYFNFSHQGTNTEGWNDVTLNDEFTGGFKDVKGKDSGIILRSSEHFWSANTSGPQSTDTSMDMPSDVSQTALLGCEIDLDGNPSRPSATLYFTHLNKTLTYDFSFFASRAYTTDNRETQFTLAGSETKSVCLNASGNATHIATISDMRPDGDGTIALTVSKGPGNNNHPNYFYYLNAMHISCHAPVNDTWQHIISEHGYDPATVNDLTDSKKIKIEEPSCAYVNITGINQMPHKKGQDMHAWLEYYDGSGNYFKKRVVLDLQGQSSIYWEKTNVSVDFCEDEWIGDEETDITIGRWVKQSSFHLKANYTGYFRGESQVGYMIYDDIVADRPEPMPWQRAGITDANEKAVGHPLGFPCYVYLNGKFYGLFAWQLKKHRKNMNMEKYVAEHIYLDGILSNQYFWNGQINWKKFEVRNPKGLCCIDDTQDEKSYVEYDNDAPDELIDDTMPCYDSSNVNHVLSNRVKGCIIQLSRYKSELNAMIAGGADKATVRKKFEEHFDVQSMLDYVVMSYVTSNGDGFERNWQWITYDGTKWYVMPYDLDCIFGNMWQGTFLFPPEVFWYYAQYDHMISTGPNSCFLNYYKQEIAERYRDLRYSGQISCESFIKHFRTWYNRVGVEGYSLEYDKWPNSPCNGETVLNPNWTTSDQDWLTHTWDDYYKINPYDKKQTYQCGDKCSYADRIWTATGTTVGEEPYIKLAHSDSFERLENYMNRKIELLDGYFGYNYESYRDGMKNLASDKQANKYTKVIRDGHLYIVRDGKTYTVEGKRARR